MPDTVINAGQISREASAQEMGGFETTIHPTSQTIHVEGIGFWSMATLDAHFDRLRTIINGHRARGLPVRVLVDLRLADVQKPEIIARIGIRTSEIYALEDRVAIVVATSLAKLQMRRAVQRLQHEFFVSESAATTWLHAYS